MRTIVSLFFPLTLCFFSATVQFYARGESTDELATQQEKSATQKPATQRSAQNSDDVQQSNAQREGYTFAKVKGKSWLLGKDRFLQYYLMEPGDLFDLDKHAHSLAKVREALKNEGYLNAKVTDALAYDKKSKTVTVTLTIVAGSQYTVEKVCVSLQGATEKEVASLSHDLQSLLESELLGNYLMKEMVDKKAAHIKSTLMLRGYARPRLSLVTTRDDKRAKVTLTYTIALPPKKQFMFEGNQFFSSELLLGELFALEDQGVALPLEMVAEDVEQLYKTKGFFEVSVDWKEVPGTVIFIIQEGQRAQIAKAAGDEGVRFIVQRDPLTVHDGEVDRVLKKFLKKIYGLGYYDEELLYQLKERAMLELAKRGYWDAAIDIRPSDPHQFILVISGVDRKVMIQDVGIKEYPELVKQEPFKAWKTLSEPRALSPQVVDEQRKWLHDYFRERGYLYATAEYALTETIAGPLLEWTIDTKRGPVKFGQTKVVGLQRMKPEIVERELMYAPGDVYNRLKIEQTAQRLKNLNMFESVSISPDATSLLEWQPMIIRVREDDPYEIRSRLGFQFVSKSFTHLSWTTYKVGGSFIWKNPAGIADRLILDADLTRYTRDLIASYELPWLGPLPVRSTFRLYSTRFDQPLISSNHHRLYKEAHDGLSVTFHHSRPWWMSDVRMGFELNRLYGISRELARVIQFEPALVDRLTPYLYIEPTVTFEHFDRKADPCRGFYTFLTLKAMVPPGVSDGWFVKCLFEQSLFYPLYRSLIGALRWRVGHIFNSKFSTILPTERFYLGGASTLRGYETNMVPPLNDVKCDGTCFWVPVGGKSMVNINAELRFPIYRWFSGVLFTDMGVLAQDRFADIAANKWLGATGFGIRLATPLLEPIRFDIGWKWKKRNPQDKSYAWFLTLGHAF